jgi:monoamine oxidase
VTELCGEFVDSDHEVLHGLIKRFGLKTVNLEQRGVRGGQSITYLSNHYRGAEEMAQEFEPIPQPMTQN